MDKLKVCASGLDSKLVFVAPSASKTKAANRYDIAIGTTALPISFLCLPEAR